MLLAPPAATGCWLGLLLHNRFLLCLCKRSTADCRFGSRSTSIRFAVCRSNTCTESRERSGWCLSHLQPPQQAAPRLTLPAAAASCPACHPGAPALRAASPPQAPALHRHTGAVPRLKYRRSKLLRSSIQEWRGAGSNSHGGCLTCGLRCSLLLGRWRSLLLLLLLPATPAAAGCRLLRLLLCWGHHFRLCLISMLGRGLLQLLLGGGFAPPLSGPCWFSRLQAGREESRGTW